jgi:hypothetical protein
MGVLFEKGLYSCKTRNSHVIVLKNTIANQIFHGVVIKRKQKLIQFDMCFYMISKGKPMTNYENMNKLLQFLDFKDSPKMHWFNTIGWGMATSMHELVINKNRGLVQATRFISISCHEITCDQ